MYTWQDIARRAEIVYDERTTAGKRLKRRQDLVSVSSSDDKELNEVADANVTLIAHIGHIGLISYRFCHMNLKLAIFGLNSLSENGSKYQKSQILIICQNMQNIYL